MQRRQARLRREYIYRKSIEQRDRQIAEKKQKIRTALENDEKIPYELRDEAINIQGKLGWDDKGADGVVNHCDDEYRWAGVTDPKVIITTSRDPSSRLRQFAQEMKLLIPNSQRINRGNCQENELMNAARANDITDVIILMETRGKPDGLVVCHLPFGPTAYFTLSNCVLRHDITKEECQLPPMTQAFPHLIFDRLTTPLGKRVMSVLKFLFPVPKQNSRRVVTFANNNDLISFRNHIFKKNKETKSYELVEIGPRFEMKLYKLILGTLETVQSAQVEWILRPYMNTAKKRLFLS